MSLQGKSLYAFDSYRLDARERVLFLDGEVVPLAPKAITLLVALVENCGHVMGKDELMKQVWPETFVEEANLSHHVSILRKALGGDKSPSKYIETIPRRGYRFVGSVREVRDETVALIEHSRAHIVIEEDTSDAQPNATEAPRSIARSSEPAAFDASKARRRLLTRKPSLAVLAVGLALAGGAAIAVLKALSPGRPEERPVLTASPRNMTITRVTNSGKVCGAIISPDGRFISYFENYTSGAGTLYVRQRDTNNEIRLLEPDQRFFGGSAFSPDGAHIFYVVFDKRDPDGALYRIPVLGGPPTRLLGNFKSQFTLSRDGAQVAFYRDEPGREHESIVIATLASAETRTLLTYARSEMTLSGVAAWSPDGAQIAFAAAPAGKVESREGGVSLRIINVLGGDVSELSKERFVEVGKMNWTADGRGLVFVASRPRAGNQLYVLSNPERELRRITTDLVNYSNYGLSITSDASAMVVDTWDSTAQIWVVDADGEAGGAKQVTLGISDGRHGLAALDRGRIAYVARNGGEHDIWTVNEDGTGARPLTADKQTVGDSRRTLHRLRERSRLCQPHLPRRRRRLESCAIDFRRVERRRARLFARREMGGLHLNRRRKDNALETAG